MDEEKIRELLIAEFRAIPPREELEKMYTFSERHNKLMEAMFAEERRKERFERYFRAVRRIAIAMLALLGCAVVSLEVVPTVYAYVEAWIAENADDRLIFKDNDMEEDRGEKEDLRFELGYVPEGYALVGENVTLTDMHVIFYKNYEGMTLQLKYYGKPSENQVSIDTEGVLVDKVVMEDTLYYVFEREDDKIIVTWENENILFSLRGLLKRAEMLDVAISVKVVDKK